MATLEKIRSKSVLLIVVIGVALLAFIIGDAITNSRNIFGNGTTVAKIGNEKIDYTEYQRKREELNNQLEQFRRTNPQQAANFDPQLLGEMAIEQLAAEKLLDGAVSKLGLGTSPEQLRYYMIEQPVNQNISTFLQKLNEAGISAQTPAQAYEIIWNPKRNGLTDKQVESWQRYWISLEEETKQLIKRQNYQRLLYGTVQANELDKKALYNDYVSTQLVAVAFQPYGQLDEKKYPVSDAELKNEYEARKGHFKVQEPTKSVSFINVNIAPSDADRKASAALAQKTVSDLANDSTGAKAKNLRKDGVAIEHKQLRAVDLPAGPVKEYVMGASNGQIALLTNSVAGFTAVKMGSRSSEVDSIQLNIVQVSGNVLPAKVLARLNAGLPADSLSKVFPADSVMVQTEQWIPLFTAQGRTQAIEEAQLDSLVKAAGRYVTLAEAPQGAVIAKLVKQNAPVAVYDYDLITYNLHPSEATVNAERTKLEKFLAANNTAEKFKANAAKEGYNVMDLELTQSSAAVPRFPGNNQYLFPDSRQVVRWVMIDGKPGQVSHIYESKDIQQPVLYAVAVNEEYSDYQPLSMQKDYLTDRVRKAKAGDELVKQYQGKSVDAAATAMGVTVANDSTFRFGRNMNVRDAAVVGQIAGTAKGAAKAVKGDNGVYVFQVNGTNVESFPYNDDQYKQQYMQLINPDMNAMLKGSKKLQNNAYKFEAGE